MSRPTVTQVAVVGLGTMGLAIARTLMAQGLDVHGFAPQGIGRGPDASGDGTTMRECVENASIVFEAVTQDLAVKEPVLREIATWTPGIIASNTSTFMPHVLASFVDQPERLLVAHFFNPADVVPLVEMVPHEGTSIEGRDGVERILRPAGKKAVVLEPETIGVAHLGGLESHLESNGTSAVPNQLPGDDT